MANSHLLKTLKEAKSLLWLMHYAAKVEHWARCSFEIERIFANTTSRWMCVYLYFKVGIVKPSPVFSRLAVPGTGSPPFLQPGAEAHSAYSSWSGVTAGRCEHLGRLVNCRSCLQSRILQRINVVESTARQKVGIMITLISMACYITG